MERHWIGQTLKTFGAVAVGVAAGMAIPQMFGGWEAPMAFKLLGLWYLLGGSLMLLTGAILDPDDEDEQVEG